MWSIHFQLLDKRLTKQKSSVENSLQRVTSTVNWTYTATWSEDLSKFPSSTGEPCGRQSVRLVILLGQSAWIHKKKRLESEDNLASKGERVATAFPQSSENDSGGDFASPSQSSVSTLGWMQNLFCKSNEFYSLTGAHVLSN